MEIKKRLLKELSYSWDKEQILYEYWLLCFLSKDKQEIYIKKSREWRKIINDRLNRILLLFNNNQYE